MLGIFERDRLLLDRLRCLKEAERPRLPCRTRARRFGRSRLALDGHGAMVVAMRSMGMMQMSIHEIVDMVPMRNCGVAAIRAVDVIVSVPTTVMVGRAGTRVGRTNCQLVLLDLPIGELVVQMSVMQIVDMALVFNSCVTAVRPVLVRVIGMQST
jgi:hypothetical protein